VNTDKTVCMVFKKCINRIEQFDKFIIMQYWQLYKSSLIWFS